MNIGEQIKLREKDSKKKKQVHYALKKRGKSEEGGRAFF